METVDRSARAVQDQGQMHIGSVKSGVKARLTSTKIVIVSIGVGVLSALGTGLVSAAALKGSLSRPAEMGVGAIAGLGAGALATLTAAAALIAIANRKYR